MPMPREWVDRVFARLLVRYGADWLRRWEGVPEDALKADWAEQLDGFERSPDRIRFALDNLPERVPTVTEFRTLCNRRPDPAQLALPPVKADPARVASELSRMRAGIKAENPKAWAWRLRDRENAGERLTIAQRDMWRAALKSELDRAEEAA
jgi:hypothetical protein